MNNRFEIFSTSVTHLVKTLQMLKSRKMAQYDLKGTTCLCLCQILASESGLTASELSAKGDIDKAQVSRIINDLCARGYVIETEDESINYKKRLKLTPMGNDIAEQINELVLIVNAYVSKDFTMEEIDVFYRVFDVICERLKESEDSIDVDSVIKHGRKII